MRTDDQDKNRQGIRLLYMEEETDTRRMTVAMLRRHFGEVIAASRWDEAIEILQRYHPHVIVTDTILKDGNFAQHLEKVKEAAEGIPYVIYTSTPGLAPPKGYRGVILKKPAPEEKLLYAIDRIIFS